MGSSSDNTRSKVSDGSAAALLSRYRSNAGMRWLLAVALTLPSALVYAQRTGCELPGPTKGDYIGDRRQLEIVERFHFTPRHEILVTDARQGILGSDFDYTLRSFPNHHRALIAMRKLSERERADPPRGAGTTVECYFQRAVKFRPDDTVSRMLYADYLIDKSRPAEAQAQLQAAEQHIGDNPLTIYNLGLMYSKLKQFDTALGFAQRAIEMGVPHTGLREQLVAAGHWRDPVPAAPGPAKAAASATN